MFSLCCCPSAGSWQVPEEEEEVKDPKAKAKALKLRVICCEARLQRTAGMHFVGVQFQA